MKMSIMTLSGRLLNGWNMLKSVRVLLSVLILVSSIVENHKLGILFGAFFTLASLLTDGACCFTSNCQPQIKQNTVKPLENIEYEELGAK